MNGKKITCFKVENKRAVIEYFYEMESEKWHRNIHKNKGTKEENVTDTLDSISEKTELYLVKSGNKKAAFFGYYEEENGKALVGFHVGKEFRNKDFLIDFWEEIKSIFKTDFSVGIYEANKRAMNHLLFQGFKIVNTITVGDKKFNILLLKL